MIVFRKVLYTIIYLFMGYFLFWNMNNMAALALDDSASGGSNPYLIIFFDLCCLLFCFISSHKRKFPKFGLWLFIFLLYTIIISIFWGLRIGFSRQASIFVYFQPLLLFLVEFHAQQDDGFSKLSRLFAVTLMMMLTALFFVNYNQVSYYKGDYFHSTNSSYFLLYFLPFLCLFIKEKNRKYAFGLMFLVIMLSSKRGGLLAFLLGLVFYYLYLGSNKKNASSMLIRFGRLVIVLIVLYALFVVVNNYMGGVVLDRIFQIGDDEGSGRLDIWTFVWLAIQNSTIDGKLFGHGFNTAINTNPMSYSAHNDFLEVIYDFGWIAFFLQIAFIVSTFIHIRKSNKCDSKITPVLALAMGILITNSMFSHIVIYTRFLNLFVICFGAICGMESKNKHINNQQTTTLL